ncbi:MAG: tyrosine--tRNA ligase [Oscillatoriales cyanobacterium CG2_30_44_21]|nr:MAG: tyrosine--tRNA ligase [Oscillatoriales cyanobacterium CG2_30_44_21]
MSSSIDPQTAPQTQAILLERGVVEIFPNSESENLSDRLIKSDRPLRIKLGIDPTRPDLHLGHTVALRKLRQFQDAGHKAVLIIGDFTAQIGDPTGRSEARPRLTPEEVAYNAETYLEQAQKILDFSGDRFELRRNGEWLNKLDLQQIINLQASMTVGQMLAKEGFSDRYDKGNPIYLHEFLYPLLQGYDSVAIDADVELGGTDQKFNILVGRDLQIKNSDRQGKPAQFGLLLPLLVGLDGVQKMSKSLGNYVGITDEPLSMYSKLEKVPDTLVDEYFELLTNIDLATLPDNPREKQKQLALAIVGQYHGHDAALQAKHDAEQIVLAGNTADLGDIPEFDLSQINFPAPLHYLIKASGLCKSNSEAQSQIKNGAVKLDGEKLGDRAFNERNELAGKVLQVGKKKFLRLI